MTDQLRSAAPIPMFLNCPSCGARHIDEGDFATKVHHTHSCQSCGLTWRPAIEPTVGVAFLPGFKNAPDPRDAEIARLRRSLENCRAIAAREGAKAKRQERYADGEPWAHVLRFCSDVGVGGSVLRTDASAPSVTACRHFPRAKDLCCSACAKERAALSDAPRATAAAPAAKMQGVIEADQRGDGEDLAATAALADKQMREALDRIAAKHHTAHCIARQAWGDGECECKPAASVTAKCAHAPTCTADATGDSTCCGPCSHWARGDKSEPCTACTPHPTTGAMKCSACDGRGYPLDVGPEFTVCRVCRGSGTEPLPAPVKVAPALNKATGSESLVKEQAAEFHKNATEAAMPDGGAKGAPTPPTARMGKRIEPQAYEVMPHDDPAAESPSHGGTMLPAERKTQSLCARCGLTVVETTLSVCPACQEDITTGMRLVVASPEFGAKLDAEWNAAIEAAAKALVLIANHDISPVSGPCVTKDDAILVVRALRRGAR